MPDSAKLDIAAASGGHFGMFAGEAIDRCQLSNSWRICGARYLRCRPTYFCSVAERAPQGDGHKQGGREQ
jgi:hypothetical protein